MQEKEIEKYEVVGGPFDGRMQEKKHGSSIFGLKEMPETGWDKSKPPIEGMHFYRFARDNKTDIKYWSYVGTDIVLAHESKKPKILLNPYDPREETD